MSNRKFRSAMSGKGYYIALILCVSAIGISGYLYYRNVSKPTPLTDQPDASASATDPRTGDVAAVATDPNKAQTGAETPTGPAPAQKLQTAAPISGETVAEYAMDCLAYNETTRDWRVHNGMDIAAEPGTEVHAAADGTVYTVYEDETMGYTVVIRHDGGYTTKYASLDSKPSVNPGDKVKLGDVIGCVGDSALLESAIGTHVHFAVTQNDESMDPVEFLNLE